MITSLDKCRICKNSKLVDVIDLGEQVITSRFPLKGNFSTPKTPIVLVMCTDCGLIQLRDTTSASEMYEYEYGYRSGINNTMRTHLHEYQKEVLSKVELENGDIVVDIGSNDSTTLQYYPNTVIRVGIDPTGTQFKEYYGDVQLIPTYFSKEVYVNKFGTKRAKIVSSISMFYDLPNPVQFAKDIYEILDDNGIWTCEQSYLPTMLERNSIDTICHEHLEYYGLHQIKRIADLVGFKIINVKFNDCNGGSFRVYFSKKESTKYHESRQLSSILSKELELGILEPNTYKGFMENCRKEVDKLNNFIRIVKKNNKKIWVYGASTKGNCLLQFANIGPDSMEYAVERNPKKVGKMTSTGIEIISEETMRSDPPDYMLVLPWHFRDEIVKREKEYLENGGQLVFPFPTFEIVSNKPRVLITGCDGHIAHYIKERFQNEYELYGIAHRDNQKYSKIITKDIFDISDTSKLELLITTVRPSIIIHLAGISNALEAFNNPIRSLEINGMVTAYLCNIIYKNNLDTKLFNASSSEIYKGHIEYNVEEDDKNKYHCHPYSIAKIMGHSIIEFYRTQYKLPFSNGVLFMTESPHKSAYFLMNKIANHIKKLKSGDQTPLTLGSLESYRNIIHAEDTVNAIYKILEQAKGDDYLICNTKNIKVLDLVIMMYSKGGFNLKISDNTLVDQLNNNIVVIMAISDCSISDNIDGRPDKLQTLGWNPKYLISDIVLNIINN